jgi:hypothetical protein
MPSLSIDCVAIFVRILNLPIISNSFKKSYLGTYHLNNNLCIINPASQTTDKEAWDYIKLTGDYLQ